jgi:hypothetical protein
MSWIALSFNSTIINMICHRSREIVKEFAPSLHFAGSPLAKEALVRSDHLFDMEHVIGGLLPGICPRIRQSRAVP